ncbi:hypothetical protein [Sphingobium sp.]|uniref:hypothetical protein n=1 Tax=Sphingobium sp. TaxID=1912891 RepID=UPI002B66AE84|nr:hypothetical protein [Sphingobium sp.]HUD92204.1 hypothetical protein [Sphingobium sp.]
MDEEEVEGLIAELRAMLRGMGFDWAAEQAEAGIHPATASRAVARALIDAAEAVTVDLAQAELATMQLLKVDEIVFMPGPDADGDARDLVETKESIGLDQNDRVRGQQRRAALDIVSGYAPTFAALRGRLDGLV